MINIDSVVSRVLDNAHKSLLSEISLERNDILANEVGKFFQGAITRRGAIANAMQDFNLDLSEYQDVQVGTEVHLIETLNNFSYENYPVFVLKSRSQMYDFVEQKRNKWGGNLRRQVGKDSYIPVEMFNKLKVAFESGKSEIITSKDLKAHEDAVLVLKELQRSRHLKLKVLFLSLVYYLDAPRNEVSKYKRTVLDYMRDVRNGVVGIDLFQTSKRVKLSNVDPKKEYSGVWKDSNGNVLRVFERLYFHQDQDNNLVPNLRLEKGDEIEIYDYAEFKRALRKEEVRKAVDSAQLTLLVRLSQKFTQRLNEYHMAQSKAF